MPSDVEQTAAAELPGEPDSPAAAPPDEGMAPVLSDLRQLSAEAKAYVRAELAFQKSRARVLGQGGRSMALYGLFALIFVVFALGALTVGLLLALTPLVTAWGATAIVVGLWAVIAVFCGLRALATWRRVQQALAGEDQPA